MMGPLLVSWMISAVAVAQLVAVPGDMRPPCVDLILVPVGNGDLQRLEGIAAEYRHLLRLEVRVTEPMQPDPAGFHADRQQWIAEKLVMDLEAVRGPTPDGCQQPTVIGLTEEDLFIEGMDWNYAYSYRDGQRRAIVSTAQMRWARDNSLLNKSLLRDRAFKMMTKNVAVLHFRLPLNSDPRSVLYNNILGPDDLDAMDLATISRDIAQAVHGFEGGPQHQSLALIFWSAYGCHEDPFSAKVTSLPTEINRRNILWRLAHRKARLGARIVAEGEVQKALLELPPDEQQRFRDSTEAVLRAFHEGSLKNESLEIPAIPILAHSPDRPREWSPEAPIFVAMFLDCSHVPAHSSRWAKQALAVVEYTGTGEFRRVSQFPYRTGLTVMDLTDQIHRGMDEAPKR